MGRVFEQHFNRLINKYSISFVLIAQSKGRRDDGKWTCGAETRTSMSSPIIPLTQRAIYASGGKLSSKDKTLITLLPLSQALEQCRVEHKSNVYTVEEATEHMDYGNANVYLLRWVSTFDRQQAN